MRRLTYGGVFLLVASGLALGAPLAASASSAGAQKHAHTVQCTGTATGHKKVTKTGVTACTSSSLKVTRPCPSGSTIFVVSKGTTYALRPGAKPIRLPKHASLAALNKACGLSTTPITAALALPAPTTTTVLPTTTTTAPPPPPTTAPPPPPTTAPPPPPTTAAPAGCSPIDDEGGCYEPGEYCRDDDHGVTGTAGDGETITCEDNDGWRWEPT
jgi:hypothetical protein